MNILETIIAGAFIAPAIIGGIVYAVTTRKLEAHGLSWDGSSTSTATPGLNYASWFDSGEEESDTGSEIIRSDIGTSPIVNTNGAPMIPGTWIDVQGNAYGTGHIGDH